MHHRSLRASEIDAVDRLSRIDTNRLEKNFEMLDIGV